MKNKLFLLAMVLIFSAGCKDDFLDTTPANTISNVQLAENPAALQAIISGIYANIRTFGIGGSTRHIDYGLMATMAGLDMMGHDMTMAAFHWYGFFYNYDGRTQTSTRTVTFWNTYYTQVAEANSVINAVDPATTDADARVFRGQALALRALLTFNTARIYSHTYIGHESDLCIPLPDGKAFDGKGRSTVAEVYAQILRDLEEAVPLLEGYSRGTKQEVDQSVAQGFLARVYLETGDWAKAATTAAAARANYGIMDAAEWMSGFSNIAGTEVMWGSDIDAESSTVFASFFSHFDNTNNGYAGVLGIYKNIDANLYSLISDTDTRKAAFVDPVNLNADYPALPAYANIKFRDASFFEGDYIYMRSGEMALIEAEALARMNDASATQVLSDFVTTRDPGFTTSASGDALVEEIYLQRRIELWGEGTSWFDLKRLKKPLVRDYPGTNHAAFGLYNYDAEANAFRFQIPEDELNANDMINDPDDQNPL